MKFFYRLLFLLPGLGGIFTAVDAVAQQPATPESTRVLVVSPVVGQVIDQQEKATYGLFPYYPANNFQEARFVQRLSPDSAITLQASFLDGSTRQRPFTASEFRAVGVSIGERQELVKSSPAAGLKGVLPDSLGQPYAVELRSGSSFIGTLVARRSNEFDFQTKDLGLLTVQQMNIKSMVLLTTGQVNKGWEPVGNGTRIFFAPTARNLRKGEGYVQSIDIIFLGANYGITDNISMGVLVPIIPGSGLSVIALTPKVGFSVTEKFSAGGGVLFASDFESSGGIAYGVGTYGSADQNVTLGLGYLFAEGEVESSPVVVLGGATRVSRRLSLLNETYIFDGGLLGLAGIRIAATRISGSLGLLYGTYVGGIYPAYLEVTYRFGKVK